ncbi:hypothetical protein D3C72_1148910 [compost metagenome]
MIISAYVTIPHNEDAYFIKNLRLFEKHYSILRLGDELNIKDVGLLLITKIEVHKIEDAYDSRVVYDEIEIRCKWLSDHIIRK